MAKTKDYFLWAAVNPGGSGGGGGETWTEELLWENPSPTQQISTQMTLTEIGDVTTYDYLRVVYRPNGSREATAEVIVKPENINTVGIICSLINPATNTSQYIRFIGIVPSGVNEGKFCIGSNATQIGGTNKSNGSCIPTQIYGIKKG